MVLQLHDDSNLVVRPVDKGLIRSVILNIWCNNSLSIAVVCQILEMFKWISFLFLNVSCEPYKADCFFFCNAFDLA